MNTLFKTTFILILTTAILFIVSTYSPFSSANDLKRWLNVPEKEKLEFPVHKPYREKITGSWIVNIFPDQGGSFKNTVTIFKNNTLVGFDTEGLGGNGIWKKIQNKQYQIKQISLCNCRGPASAGDYTEVIANVEYIQTKDIFAGRFTTTLYTGEGDIIAVFEGDAELEALKF